MVISCDARIQVEYCGRKSGDDCDWYMSKQTTGYFSFTLEIESYSGTSMQGTYYDRRLG